MSESNNRGSSTGRDVRAGCFPTVDWSQGTATGLETLRKYVVAEIRQDEGWYVSKRKWKRRFGQATRLTVMVVVAVAGVLPMLAAALKYDINPAWTTVLLALAGLLVGLDYFYGYTSCWVRYLTTQQRITRLIQEFQIDWESMRVSWGGKEPSTDQVQSALTRLRAVLVRVKQAVEDETAVWAAEFHAAILKLDGAARTKSEIPTSAPAPLAAVTVTVTNGVASGEWTLTVDDNPSKTLKGTRHALMVSPGPHKFVVEGMIKTKSVRDEVAAEVRANGVTEVELTLT